MDDIDDIDDIEDIDAGAADTRTSVVEQTGGTHASDVVATGTRTGVVEQTRRGLGDTLEVLVGAGEEVA